MQEIVHRMLNTTYEPIKRLFKSDLELFESIIILQSNLLLGLDIQTQKKEIVNLVYGFKDQKVMNITDNMRHIITKLEKYVGMGLKDGASANVSTELIDIKVSKVYGSINDE